MRGGGGLEEHKTQYGGCGVKKVKNKLSRQCWQPINDTGKMRDAGVFGILINWRDTWERVKSPPNINGEMGQL